MSEKQAAYRVLARKYRPQNFDDLVGQEALVRTLKNAITSGRIAHAFMLTGIRGVGKTTTARIIAKALNYTGPDGTAGPTTGDTSDCDTCRAIAEDRHPDVMEMDAASRTGVDDIREILNGVRYAPVSARYKIYIIDEVHMLSKNAFNALLKTLEEPPEHVKFIFATTEIRKVPVTVLSRCQRFDLRRIDATTLGDYYKTICDKENVAAEKDAISLIARAADGSARDGLSILDQAIALSDGNVTTAQVKDMLGLADRALVLDLFEKAVSAKADEALAIMGDLYRKGADPVVVIQDLLDLAHQLTKLRAAPKLQDTLQTMGREEIERAATLASKLSMPMLGRAWQVLLKGLGELHTAPDAQKAAEMIVIRLAYAADLPDPADLIRKLKDTSPTSMPNNGGGGTRVAASAGNVMAMAQPMAAPEPALLGTIETLRDVVALLEQNGAMALASHVYLYAHPVKIIDGSIELRPAAHAPERLTQDLTQALKSMTGKRWMVSISNAQGGPTLADEARAVEAQQRQAVLDAPLVKQIFELFPDAELKAIHTKD